jgi:hypothetical protein
MKDDNNFKKNFQKMEKKSKHICTIFSKGHLVFSMWEKNNERMGR